MEKVVSYAILCDGAGRVRRNWMLASWRRDRARNLIPKAFTMSRFCCMCGEVGAFRPRRHANCSHYKLLQLWPSVMAWRKFAGIGCSQVEEATQLAV